MTLQARLARQLGHPRGAFGAVLGRVLNRGNRPANLAAVEHLGVQPGDRALDVGFGGGVGLEALLESAAATVAGVDHSPDMVERARSRFGDRVRVERASVEALPFADASFDRILSVHTVYFWPDPERGARELRRVLAPGGRLVLALGRKAWMEQRRIHRSGFTLYSDEEIAALLRAGGFADVRVEGDGPLFVIAQT